MTTWRKVGCCLIAAVAAFGAFAEIKACLPDGYLQLKWLESTGAQRINTQEVPGTTVAVKMNYNTGTYANLTALFGQGWTSSQYLFNQQGGKYYFHGNGSGVILCDAGSAIDGLDASVEILTTSADNMIVTIGEQAYTNTVSLACGGGTLNLFGCTDAARCAAFRLYDFTMWRSGALIHQWVPATNVVSGKVGIFDIANPSSANAFLVNANSGADFIPGPFAVDFRLGRIPVQYKGAQPKPAITTADGEPLSEALFDFEWTTDAAGTLGTVKVSGRPDTDYDGQFLSASYRISTRTQPATFTWAACVNGDFEDDAKWMVSTGETGHPEFAEDEVILPKFMSDSDYTVTVAAPINVRSLTVGGTDKLGNGRAILVFPVATAANTFSGDVHVKGRGVITTTGPANVNQETGSLVFEVGGNVTVDADGEITVVGKGYAAKKGPFSTGTMCQGAGHAGYAYKTSGKPYGSILHPTTWGSGNSGAAGGGAIRLDVAGTLHVDGAVMADGQRNGVYAGAGGSVWIDCAALTGSGTITATEGRRPSNTANLGDCTSSGGHIAVCQHAATDFAAFPATRFYTSSLGANAAGTVYLEGANAADCADLYVVGGTNNAPKNFVIPKTAFPMPDDGADLLQYSNVNVHVSGYAHLSVCDLTTGQAVEVRSVEVANKANLTIAEGAGLRVHREFNLSSATSLDSGTDGYIEFVGDETTTILGASKIGAIGGIVCTNAGKTIALGTAAADKLTVAKGMDFVMRGLAEAPVSLVSTAEGEPWFLSMNPNPGVYEVDHVAVQDSDASSGAPMLAISSQNLGNNANWGFSDPIVPGETITWTGGQSAKWDAVLNWDLGRAPVETDRIVIPAGGVNNPTLPSGTYLFNAIEIAAGASLTLNGCTLAVTNGLSCAGGLVFTDAEDLLIAGNATFAADSITVNSARIHLIGGGEQTIDFCETALHNVYVEKDGGGVTFTAHGFSADSFVCAASAPQYLAFAAGQTFTLPTVSLSSIGADRQLTLRSDASGTAWKLVTTESGQNISGVEAHDSDASDGALVLAGVKSVATDNCTNWDTVTSVASWLGGSGSWTDPAKWSTGEVPGAGESVSIVAAENETLTVTVPANSPVAIGALTVKGATGGTATLVANSPVTVVRNCEIWEGGVIELNCYDSAGDAPNTVTNNLRVRAGGVLSHTKGTSNTQDKMLHLRVLGDVQVDEGGKISATGKGFPQAKGPGRGSGNCHGAAFASYGYDNGNLSPYGSILRPMSWGSATDRNYNAGGAVHLVVDGTLEVNGTVEADGAPCGGDVYTMCGGSVWIECAELTGSGLVTARESAYNGRNSIDTKGSGGRIAVYQHTATDFTAFPKERILTHRNSWNQPGTVYLESADTSNGADLYVMAVSDNASLKTPFPMPDDGSDYSIYSNVNVHVGSASILSVGNLTGAARYQIRTLDVANGGKVEVVSGATLGIRLGVSVDSKSSVDVLGNALELVGGEATTLEGFNRVSNIGSLICTNAGKVVSIGTGANDVIKLGAGANLLLQGEEGNPVTLLPLDGAASWQLDANANANLSVKYVAASNATALTQAVLAMESVDLGGNVKWSFISEIKPDAPIHWTGAKSTDWGDTENWDEKRTPILTDKVYIDAVGEDGNSPVLANGVFTQLKLYVASGAKLTLSDATLVVSNEFTMAGELVFEGAEELHLAGNAGFTGGSVQSGNGVVRLIGDDSQIVDFGGVSLRYLNIAKPGGVVVMNGDLTAAILRCDAASPLDIQFDDGVTFDIADLYLNGGEKNLTLKGIETGGRWNLKATTDSQCVTGVKVSGCTATGATIYAGQNSSDDGGNVNWDFASETAVWLGGSGDWTDASHWSLGAVPSAGTQVMLNVGEGADVTITVPKAGAASVASVDVRAADGGKAKIVANGTLAVAGDAHVRANGVLELNCYDDAGEAPNVIGGDLVVHAGGRVSHTGPADSVNAKLHLKVEGDVTVEEGGSIDADSKGHRPNKGPSSANTNCESAGYAGYGHSPDSARSIDSHTSSHKPYGSILRPTDWGSSGNASSAGGAVHLVVGGTLTVNGAVSADCSNYHVDYASSGGSVWIECAAIVGTGRVSAREGDSKRANASQGYQRLCDCASSGGRIAIYQTVAKSFDSFPISRISTVRNGYNAVGTVYLESADTGAGTWLYLQTDENIRHKTKFPMEQDGDPATAFRNVNVVVKGESLLAVESDVTVRDLRCEASDTAGKNVPHVYLNGKTLKIRSMKHVNGRKWFKGYEAAIESGHVVLGGTALNPGRIEWIGGATGMMLMVK